MELLLVTLLVLVVIITLLTFYLSCADLSMAAKNTTIAAAGARAKMEEIRNYYPFYLVATDYAPGGSRGNTFHISGWLPDTRHCGAIEISDASGDGRLLEIRVTVSWRDKGNRIIGEDATFNDSRKFNGILDSGEDANGNGQLDSPVEVVTLMSSRP